jgi:DNA (cytosine-5)-methyltransferase 1
MKQIHVRLDHATYERIKKVTREQNTSLQAFMLKAALEQLNPPSEQTTDIQHDTYRFIDLFAGIGGLRLAFESAGGTCVFSSEWNKFSQITYQANFGEVPHGDITEINPSHIPDHDILLAGFPCQPFSIAGVSKKKSLGREHGFLDETQGTLFFNIAQILKTKKPRAFLLENVKNLKSHDRGKTFRIIEETLRELNYEVFYEIIDAVDYVPQHRERIYIVGFDRNFYGNDIKFDFPLPPSGDKKILADILEDEVDPKYTLSDKLWNYLQDYAIRQKKKGNGFGFGLADLEGHTRTLSARYYKDGSEILIPQKGKNPRRLTPVECKRLMGFPESFVIPVSDTQAYMQFGNSVAVPVVEAIAHAVVETLDKYTIEEELSQWRMSLQEVSAAK